MGTSILAVPGSVLTVETSVLPLLRTGMKVLVLLGHLGHAKLCYCPCCWSEELRPSTPVEQQGLKLPPSSGVSADGHVCFPLMFHL